MSPAAVTHWPPLDGYAEENNHDRHIGAATNAIVEAMGSREKMATWLLSDEGARDIFLGLLYDLLEKPEAPSLLAGQKRD